MCTSLHSRYIGSSRGTHSSGLRSPLALSLPLFLAHSLYASLLVVSGLASALAPFENGSSILYNHSRLSDGIVYHALCNILKHCGVIRIGCRFITTWPLEVPPFGSRKREGSNKYNQQLKRKEKQKNKEKKRTEKRRKLTNRKHTVDCGTLLYTLYI